MSFINKLHLQDGFIYGEVLVVGVVLVVHINGIQGCLEEERKGLLQLKASLESTGEEAAGYLLPSWVDDEENIECCNWERVTCNSTAGHVIRLSQ